MAFAAKVLGQGQLPNTKGTLYTVPGATSGYVRTIRAFNTSASSTETVEVFANTAGTSRQLCRIPLGPREHLEIDDPISLETGDLIEGNTTTATTVDYIITGAEET